MVTDRGKFTSKLGFILTAAGSAVGLGNIWKFPFEVGLGGGAAFVVMYLIFCFLLCFPVMITEIAIGRKTRKNPVGAFTSLGFKNWRFIGIFGVLAGVLILSFYNVIAGWAFGFFFEMIRGNFSVSRHFGEFTSDIIKVATYAVIFMTLTGFFVGRGVSGGIEKLSKILMPTLIIMIILIAAYAFTLPNSLEGIKFYLLPDLNEITINTIGGALRQAFFSLSLGMGTLITYGSYLSKNDNIISSAAFITLADVSIAFIAGLMIFPLVAFINHGDMSTIASDQAGPGLIFITMPQAFETLGTNLGAFVGGTFFLLLSFAALTSTVSLLEVPTAYVVDEWGISRKKAVLITSLIVFIIGLPSMLSNGASEFFTNQFKIAGSSDFLSLVSKITDSMLLFGGMCIVIFAAQIWRKEHLNEELSLGHEGFKKKLISKYLNFTITYLSPIILGILLIVVILGEFFQVNVYNYVPSLF